MMGDGAHTTIELASENLAGEQPQSYTVVRARLDQWLAEKVGEKGGMVVPNMKVDELLRKDGRVIGIRAGEDEIGADVVVVAEGALRLLAAPAGLAGKPEDKDYALGYKEVIELPAGVIEDRWNLNPGEGAAQLFLGSVTRGMLGGGFLYTNKESISLGVVVGMHAMKADGREIESHSLLEQFRELPQIKPLVAGGTVAEYSAHAIPEGGIAKVPRLYGDGYVLTGDAAGPQPQRARSPCAAWTSPSPPATSPPRRCSRRRQAGDFSAAGLAALRGRPARQLRAQGPRDGADLPAVHGGAAPLPALPDGGVAPHGGRLHHRSRPDPVAHQEGVEGRPPRLPQGRHAAGRVAGQEALRGEVRP